MKVVGVGGTEAWNGSAGLSPGGGKFRVGVDDAADLAKLAVEQGMGFEVAGGPQASLDNVALQVRNDEVGWPKLRVVNAGWLDYHQRLSAGAVNSRPIDSAGVAEGMRREAAAGDFLVGVKDFFAE